MSSRRRCRRRQTTFVVAHLLRAAWLLEAPRASAGDEPSTVAAGPTNPDSPNLHLSVGIGAASGVGPMAMANLAFDRRSYLFLARASSAREIAIFDPPSLSTQDYSLLVGKVLRERAFRGYAAIGLGVASVTRRGEALNPGDAWFPDYKMMNDKVVNVPLQVGFSADCGFAGIGLTLTANMNGVFSDVGVALTGSLGKLH